MESSIKVNVTDTGFIVIQLLFISRTMRGQAELQKGIIGIQFFTRSEKLCSTH
jgi:hypothetical protein